MTDAEEIRKQITINDAKFLLTIAAAYDFPGLAELAIDCGALSPSPPFSFLNSSPNYFVRNSHLTDPPILSACKYGSVQVAQCLIRKGVSSVNSADYRGTTPMHMAAEGGHVKTIKFLIEEGGNVNAKNRDGRTPLDFAVFKGNVDAARFLLSKGARPTIYAIKFAEYQKIDHPDRAQEFASLIKEIKTASSPSRQR